jgi:hypothetical protein
MTLPDLVTSLRRQADIAASTDRGAVLAEAADRLEALAADGERLDFIEAERATISSLLPDNARWIVYRPEWERYRSAVVMRDAIDAARKGRENTR